MPDLRSEQLMQLYIKQMSVIYRPTLAVDHTVWSRPHARTLKERTYEHQPAVLPSHAPVGVGLGYSTMAWIPEAQGSWALPLRHERISSWDTPITKAASQLQQVLEHLPHRPLVLFDREYGCAPLVLPTAGLSADKLMRLRSNRCLYAAPPAYSGRGRPRRHGAKFKLNDPATWWADDGSVELEDSALGRLQRRQWQNLDFGASAADSMTLILLERKDGASNPRQAKPLWLVWVGESLSQLEEIGQLYLRRFAIDHWYRQS